MVMWQVFVRYEQKFSQLFILKYLIHLMHQFYKTKINTNVVLLISFVSQGNRAFHKSIACNSNGFILYIANAFSLKRAVSSKGQYISHLFFKRLVGLFFYFFYFIYEFLPFKYFQHFFLHWHKENIYKVCRFTLFLIIIIYIILRKKE